MKIEITPPNTALIAAGGPVQCGKSVVMLRLAQLLSDEFGATVVLSESLRSEKNMCSAPEQWELDLVRGTIWVLGEQTS